MGYPTGKPTGRPKGALNKRPKGLLAQIKVKLGKDFDPVMFMAETVADKKVDRQTRLAAARDLTKYIYPQLRAVEVTGPGGGPLQTQVQLEASIEAMKILAPEKDESGSS